MSKKFDKKLLVAMPGDLFDSYQRTCEERYTTMSQEVRTFMLQFIKEHDSGKEKNE